MRLRDIAGAFFVVLPIFVGRAAMAEEARVVGWIEAVVIHPEKLRVRAKVDTGAKTSSLNAMGMKRFKRNGTEWVSFTVTNRQGKSVSFERPIVRIVRIRRHAGRSQQRPTILMRLCLGGVYRETEVSLIDRSGFNYQMLIGRRFMDGRIIVDPSRTFRTKPTCRDAPPS